MSAPRTLSLGGLLVAMTLSLAACGSNSDDLKSAADNGTAAAATPTPSPAPAGNALSKISPTAHDPLGCEFLSVSDVKAVVPAITKKTQPAALGSACTFSDAKGDQTPSLNLIFLSKSFIQASITGGFDPKQTLRHAWDVQQNTAAKQKGYADIKNLGDTAYSQTNVAELTIRWFIKDHAYYMHYNFNNKKPSQKKVTINDLIALARKVKAPEGLPHP